jgi:hypothetical protein
MPNVLISDAERRVRPLRSLRIVEERVDQVLAIDDAAVRNMWITQTYADLAKRLRPVLGPDQTWCSFATWVSATAGVSIRAGTLPRLVDDLLVGGEHVVDEILRGVGGRTWIRRRLGLMSPLDRAALVSVVEHALADVGDLVDRRTTEVFADLAPAFVRFVAAVESGDEADPATIAGGRAEDDRELVRLAFGAYLRACDPTAPTDRRAEQVLAGNLALMLHEQRRTQEAVEAPFGVGLPGLHDAIAERLDGRLPARVRARVVGSVLDEIDEHVDDLWYHVSTRLLMTIILPGEVLHVGRDLPPTAAGHMFPAELRDLRDPTAVDLARRCDPDGHPQGVGCRDWTNETERVRYLARLLRSRQQDPSLATPPFTPAEVTVIERGELPPLS